jgi:hypothetical protein
LLERPLRALEPSEDNTRLTFEIRPYEIVTIRVRPS